MNLFTKIISALWGLASAIARMAARKGWIQRERLPARVVSVGNLQAGGAGKTPIVAALAKEAISRGLRVCILSRGYQSEWEKDGGVIGPQDRVHPAQCGDEAALLHTLVPEAWIGIGARRAESFYRALSRSGALKFDLVILDDGFQHHRLHKDFELVLLTSRRPYECLFRDWNSALRFASLVIWTKGEQSPDSRGRPLIKAGWKIRFFRQGAPGPYVLATGVADGGEVEKSLRREGFTVQRHLRFPDHARYSLENVTEVLRLAAEAGCRVLITGKDWVKWDALGLGSRDLQPVDVIEPELIGEIQGLWDKVLSP